MTPERWGQIEKLFYSALEREPGVRAAFLDEACAGDEALRQDLETLLSAHDHTERDFEAIKAEVAADLLAEDKIGSMAGMTLGRYHLLSPLGSGGMGEVYRALDTRLDREVAVKILPARLADNTEAMRRFEREAKAVAALSHPNILSIHDFGTEQGVRYAVMELLKGETLRSRLSRGALPWRKAVGIGVEIAEGMSAAHAKGITHRDLKPENIFLTLDGRTKILDFGLARIEASASDENITSAPTATFATEPGFVMGTPGYMSPEQARGDEVEAPSDIFSLGSVLYEMVTGRRPFAGKTVADTMAAILRDDPPELADSGKTVPPDLAQVITHCLEKNPAERFQSARDLAFALKTISGGSGPSRFVPARWPARFRAALIVAASAVLLLGAWRYLRLDGIKLQSSGQIQSIAVMPLESGAAEYEYFADGMTGELIDTLGQIGTLKVISGASVMRYKGTRKPTAEIARELNVEAVIQGSVLLFDESVRITARLIHATTGQPLWANSYQQNIRNISALQNQLAQAITQVTGTRLTQQEQDRLERAYTVDPEAHQLYLKGRSYFEKRAEEDIKKAIDYFNQAIVKDPNYAMAYVGMANAYIRGEGTLPPALSMRIARLAAIHALGLNNNLADGHTSLAVVHMLNDWDWPAAEREFKQAIEIQSSNATAHHWYAEYLTALGRREEAIAEIKRAQELDPLSVIIHRDVAWHYYCAGNFDQAIAQLLNTLKMNPDSDQAHWLLGLAYVKKGMFAEAIAKLQRAVALSPSNNNKTMLGYAYASAGQQDNAQQILNTINGLKGESHTSPYLIAAIYGALNDREQAFLWLEKAYDEHSDILVYLKVDPILENLRADPKFRNLIQRVRLPE
ncbi:MAG TPA: protein kinase [Blastocatellia bacterium]|jgi:serine/threonine-protein kinase|nr:protein kinase [Blastocatellia bacterium]